MACDSALIDYVLLNFARACMAFGAGFGSGLSVVVGFRVCPLPCSGQGDDGAHLLPDRKRLALGKIDSDFSAEGKTLACRCCDFAERRGLSHLRVHETD